MKNRTKKRRRAIAAPTTGAARAHETWPALHVRGFALRPHLVSDSTGETLNAMARAVCARFDDVLPIEHIYSLVRSPRQLERVLSEIQGAPGVVLHTIVDKDLRAALEKGCRGLEMTCVAALDPLVAALARYLGASLSTRVGAQHALDNDYFNRMEALSYAIGHDDGQGTQDLDAADVVLVGVSRTSKTPCDVSWPKNTGMLGAGRTSMATQPSTLCRGRAAKSPRLLRLNVMRLFSLVAQQKATT